MLSKRNTITTAMIVLMVAATSMIGGCKKDNPAARKTVYQLGSKDQLGVSGTVTFTETSSTVTTVSITLTGGDAVSHPAHIHMNSAIEGGNIVITLNPVVNGTSTTTVTMEDNSTPISYSQLILFDGYVNVHESSADLTTILAQGDIGGNALTGAQKTYVLDSVGVYNVTGTALFQKRVNGNTLSTITLAGTLSGGSYPAAIHLGSVATVGGGPVTKTLNPVDGSSGKGYTNIRTLDAGTPISYDELLVYDGYIAIQQSPSIPTTICEGNIGSH